MDLLERARPLDDLGRLMLEAASGAGRLILMGCEAGEAAGRAGEILRTLGASGIAK